MRTMQRIVHCKQHVHRRHPTRKNVQKEDKPPLVALLSNQMRTTKRTGRTCSSTESNQRQWSSAKECQLFYTLIIASVYS